MFNFKKDEDKDKFIKVNHEGFTGDAAIEACLTTGAIDKSNENTNSFPFLPFQTIISTASKEKKTVKVGIIKTTGNN